MAVHRWPAKLLTQHQRYANSTRVGPTLIQRRLAIGVRIDGESSKCLFMHLQGHG